MIDGIGKGNSYNYLGMPLEAGQNPFTIDQLLALETQLAPKGELEYKNCRFGVHPIFLFVCIETRLIHTRTRSHALV